MEAASSGLDLARLARDVTAVPAITGVHDLHVWSLAGGMRALPAHVLLSEDCQLSACDGLLDRIEALLASRYWSAHSTIQFEYACCERHGPDALYCGGIADGHVGHEHAGGGCTHAVPAPQPGALQHGTAVTRAESARH